MIPSNYDFQETFPTMTVGTPQLGTETHTSASAVDRTEMPVEFLFKSGPLHAAELDLQDDIVVRNARSLVGMSVSAPYLPLELGRVRDLLCDFESEQILALVLETRELIGHSHRHDARIVVVPWCKISALDEDAVVVENENAKVRLSDDDELCIRTDDKGTGLFSVTQVLSNEGSYLGMLADLQFNEKTGKIIGHRLADEKAPHSSKGRKFAPIFPLDPTGIGH